MPSDGMKYEQAMNDMNVRRKALSDMIKKRRKGPKARIPENAPERVTLYPVRDPRPAGGRGKPTRLPRYDRMP